jgi:hypothetical protein
MTNHTDMVDRVAKAIESTMFAPHELPCDAELHARYCETARAVLAVMSEWQPIETAPMDVDVILGWWESWPGGHQWRQVIAWASSSNPRSPSNTRRIGKATHWMPIPAPPGAPVGGNYPGEGLWPSK